MKKFTFRLDNSTEVDLIQKAMESLHRKGIEYTASYTENERKQTIIVISVMHTKS